MRRREYVATGLWALVTALAVLAYIYTGYWSHAGVLLLIPVFVLLQRYAVIGRARHGILLGSAAFPTWLAAFHEDTRPLWVSGGLVLAFLAVWVIAGPDWAHHADADPDPAQ